MYILSVSPLFVAEISITVPLGYSFCSINFQESLYLPKKINSSIVPISEIFFTT
nr:MAG TPA: hypothetical protein [Caudoviricetes sp.]